MYMYVCVYNEIKPPQTVIEKFVHALKSQTNAENVEQGANVSISPVSTMSCKAALAAAL